MSSFLVVALAYVMSFALPAYRYFSENPAVQPSDHDGAFCFKQTIPRENSIWYISASWIANPVLWVGSLLLLIRRWRLAFLFGLVAFLLGLLVFIMPPILGHRIWSVPAYRIGYWLWLSSMIALAVAGIVGWVLYQSNRVSPNDNTDSIESVMSPEG